MPVQSASGRRRSKAYARLFVQALLQALQIQALLQTWLAPLQKLPLALEIWLPQLLQIWLALLRGLPQTTMHGLR